MTLITLGLAWLAGLVAGRGLEPSPVLALPAVASCAAALIGRGCWVLRWGGAALAVLLLGIWRGAAAAPLAPEGPLTPYRGQRVALEGTVADVPRCGPLSCVFTLSVDQLETSAGASAIAARVQVRVRSASAELYGQRLRASGALAAPRPLLGYPRAAILARRGVYEVLEYPSLRRAPTSSGPVEQPLERWRTWATRLLSDRLPGDPGELAAGVVLGQATPLSPELVNALRATGTSHIAAVSGFNVALVGGTLLLVGRRCVGPVPAGLLSLGAVVLYTLVVGAPASAVRAALMFGLAVLAGLVGRLPDALTSLVLAAAVMAGVDPTLLGDLGFQLSFAATAGLVLYGQWPLPALPKLVRGACAGLVATFAAELATLPIVLHTFHQASLVAPLANLLIAPALPALVAATSAFLVLGMVPVVGDALAELIRLLSGYVLGVIQSLARWPLASFATGGFPAWAVGASYGCLLAPKGVAWLARALRPGARTAWIPAVLALSASGLVAVLVLASLRPPVTGPLRAQFFDIGGDGLTLVETESGRRMVVGSAASSLAAAALADRLPFLDRAIDLLVVLERGPRTGEGLGEIVRRFPVRHVLEPGGVGDDAVDEWERLLISQGVSRLTASTGTTIELEDGVRLVVEEVAGRGADSSTLSIRLEAGALELGFVSGGLDITRPTSRPLVLRLQPDAAATRRLPALLGGPAPPAAVVGGRRQADVADGRHFPLEGDAIVELASEGEAFLLRYARCTPEGRFCSERRVLGERSAEGVGD